MTETGSLLKNHEADYIKSFLSEDGPYLNNLMAVTGRSKDYRFLIETPSKLEVRTPTTVGEKSFIIDPHDISFWNQDFEVEEHVWEVCLRNTNGTT
jgi:hypothetical protein